LERNIKSITLVIVMMFSGFTVGHVITNIEEYNKRISFAKENVDSISQYRTMSAKDRCFVDISQGCSGCVKL